MQPRHLLVPLLASLAISAHAASETYYFKFSDLLQSESAQKLMDPAVTLYWGDQPLPNFSEVARPDINTRMSTSAFGGSQRHCVQAFEAALKDVIRYARHGGYDAVINIRATLNRKPVDDPLGFSCTPGFRTTEVGLWSSFAMTPEALQRMLEAERRSADVPPRAPAEGAIFLHLDSLLTSPEAQAIFGSDIKAYWGLSAPDYREREVPDTYTEDVPMGTLQVEEACRQAVLKALGSMVREAKAKRFDSVIKIRSFLNKQFAPVITDVECRSSKKAARVTLQSSLANRK